MISTVVGHKVGVVEKAIEIFKRMEFIEILDNGAIYMLDIQNFIGQSSNEADRRRNYRKMINSEKSMLSEDNSVTNVMTNDGQMSQQMYDKCTPEIEIDIEYRDKENINILTQSSGRQTSEPEADVAALLLNDGTEWRPTEALFAEYVRLYPNVDVKQQFNEMRGWCISNPSRRKTRRGITRFVNSWLSREQDRGNRRPPAQNSCYQNPSANNQDSGYSPELFERMASESRQDVIERKGRGMMPS